MQRSGDGTTFPQTSKSTSYSDARLTPGTTYYSQVIASKNDFEPLAEPRLNAVCFRYRPEDVSDRELDGMNRRLGHAIVACGRVYFCATVYAGHIAFRPAIATWRTSERDVDLILPVTRELAEANRTRFQGKGVERAR